MEITQRAKRAAAAARALATEATTVAECAAAYARHELERENSPERRARLTAFWVREQSRLDQAYARAVGLLRR